MFCFVSVFCLVSREELKKKRLERMQSLCDLPPPRKLRWHITPQTQEEINSAMETMDEYESS